MRQGDFVAKQHRPPDDAEHYVGYVHGVRVGILYRPDLDAEKPWAVQWQDGTPISWHETEHEAVASARARPAKEG